MSGGTRGRLVRLGEPRVPPYARGMGVYDRAGYRIGVVEGLYADAEGGRARLLDVAAGGFLPVRRRYLLPVEAVAEVLRDGVVVEHDHEKVAASPPFDPASGRCSRDVYAYYGYAPPGRAPTRGGVE